MDQPTGKKETTVVSEEVNVQVFEKMGMPEAGWIFDGMIGNNYFSFAHNNEIWKFKIGVTMELAVDGTGPDTLLFAVNGHYVGPMSEQTVDKIVGTCCALYKMASKEPVITPPAGLVS